MTMTEDVEFEAEGRQLCPDGSCIGVLGDDGRCKVCGLATDGTVAAPESGEESAQESAPDAEAAVGPDADDRRLCPDGACIGLIGDDGRCKVCGRGAE